jgi:hypothetical protein
VVLEREMLTQPNPALAVALKFIIPRRKRALPEIQTTQ